MINFCVFNQETLNEAQEKAHEVPSLMDEIAQLQSTVRDLEGVNDSKREMLTKIEALQLEVSENKLALAIVTADKWVVEETLKSTEVGWNAIFSHFPFASLMSSATRSNTEPSWINTSVFKRKWPKAGENKTKENLEMKCRQVLKVGFIVNNISFNIYSTVLL